MYEYLKKLKVEKDFAPARILDIGAWNGFWTKNVKQIWPDAHYTCVEAGPKPEDGSPKILHYTEGGPWFDGYRHCDYSDDWKKEAINLFSA